MKSVSTEIPRLFEHAAEVLGGDGLGEGTVEWGDVGQLHTIAHTALGEEGIGEEDELERRHRALDRHLDDVEHEPTALPFGQNLAEPSGAFQGVEVVDRDAVVVAVEALGLVASWVRTRGDDELVVRQLAPVDEGHDRLVGLDDLDLAHDQIDTGGEELRRGLDDVCRVVRAERDEQVAGLVVVLGFRVDDGDRPIVDRESGPQLVGSHRSGRACPENEKLLHDRSPPWGDVY